MNRLPPALLFATLALAGCTGSQSTVTVPPQQEFLLGEDEEGGFTAKLRNVGDVEITVQTRSSMGQRLSSFGFPAGGETTVTVGAGEVAVFVNPSAEEAVIQATLDRDVQGMRYEPTGAAAAPDVAVDITRIAAMIGEDWVGTLTYIDYTSGERTEIAAEVDVRQVGPDAFAVSFNYPDEPAANDSSRVRVEEAGRRFDGRAVVSAEQTGDAYEVRTAEQTIDGGEEVVRFFTYRVSADSLTIRSDYQTLGSTELNFRNAYRFSRQGRDGA